MNMWKGRISALLVFACLLPGPLLAAPGPSPSHEFLGVALGEPLSITECAFKVESASGGYPGFAAYDGGREVLPCWRHRILFDAGKPLADGDFELRIANYPDGVEYGSVRVTVLGGIVEGVYLNTKGFSAQRTLLGSLSSKFGKPSSLTTETMSNAFGAVYESLFARWEFADMSITLLGIGSRVDSGSIDVRTPKGLAHREAEQQPAAGF